MNFATPPDPREQTPGHALAPGRNCWRIEQAGRARLLVDAADYFAAARRAMMEAEERIMLIGWDFDARISLDPDDGSGEAPSNVGDFVLWLAKRRPGLQIHLLRWNVGATKMLLRGRTPLIVARWALHDNVHLRFDSAHPVGAAHHQKIVVIDDCLAFCGGIDMTGGRWDTRDHSDRDPRRVWPGGGPCPPWHDATMALEGPAAAALGEVARQRWRDSGGDPLDPVRREGGCWPDGLEPHFRDVDVAISRTRPEHDGAEACREIEALYVDLIARARRFVYAESQYFASRRIAEAIADRLRDPDGPEIVLINPKHAWGWIEQEVMDSARARLHGVLMRLPGAHRFRIYHPVTAEGAPIYVHAKLMIVDDQVLRVGSANWNNRSMGLDSECDVTLDAMQGGNGGAGATIRRLREELMAEHLGVEPERIGELVASTGSLIGAVERLRGPGRSLREYAPPALNGAETGIVDSELLDPEGSKEMFEPLRRRSLFRRLPRPISGSRW